jgi:hypothetical protein
VCRACGVKVSIASRPGTPATPKSSLIVSAGTVSASKKVRQLWARAEIKSFASSESLSKTEVFERACRNGKIRGKSGLNLSRNSFLISTSQKVRVRLSFERVHDDQTDKDHSHSRAGEAATSTGRAEDRADAIIRCRRGYVETDAHRLRPGVDR